MAHRCHGRLARLQRPWRSLAAKVAFTPKLHCRCIRHATVNQQEALLPPCTQMRKRNGSENGKRQTASRNCSAYGRQRCASSHATENTSFALEFDCSSVIAWLRGSRRCSELQSCVAYSPYHAAAATAQRSELQSCVAYSSYHVADAEVPRSETFPNA